MVELITFRIDSTIADLSPFSTTHPVTPSTTSSGLPPVLYVMTGVPHAKDSMLTVGHVSVYVVLTKATAEE